MEEPTEQISAGSMLQLNWIDQLDAILKKSPQNRNHAQNVSLAKNLLQVRYFQDLAKQTNPQIIKHIVKHTRLVRPHKRSIVCKKGELIDCYYVVLKGKLGIEKDSCEEEIGEAHKIHDMVQMLTRVLAESEVKAPRRKGKKGDKEQALDFLQQPKSFEQHPLPLSHFHSLEEIHEEGSIGDEARQINSHRKFTAVALQDSVLLEIHFSAILKAIKFYNEKKLQMQLDFFRKYRCFDLFIDDQLKLLITHCRTEERSKNDCVFREGDPASQFYLLYEGEVCIIKTAQLFVDNPNKLYVNRKTYVRAKKAQALPYANLEKLYNYRPKQERIELGILQKDSIFGEEEAFLRTPRQTEARVCSPVAKYYVVEVADVEVALREKKYMPQDFRDFLFANLTRKKILYRQDKFSEVLNLKNKNQLDYFYIEENQPEKGSPLKYQLKKINDKIAEMSKSSVSSPGKSLSLRKQQSEQDPEERPAFNAFNFTQMIETKEEKEEERTIPDMPETRQEEKLVGLTHTTRFIQQQIECEVVLNRLRNPIKRGINLSDPLFEPDYFENLNKQNRRIEQEYRKMRFSFKMPDKKSQSLTSKNRRLKL